jgi:hypothetical protein
VSHEFDNILVPASELISKDLTQSMTQWNLTKAQNYNRKYLSGYKSELYQVGLPRGFNNGKGIMAEFIRSLIHRDIGGDHQIISSVNTRYDGVGFKLMLMPLWISAFLYKRKTFRFIINGQTGQVKGERPYSWIKIISLILLILIIVGGGVIVYDKGVI